MSRRQESSRPLGPLEVFDQDFASIRTETGRLGRKGPDLRWRGWFSAEREELESYLGVEDGGE